MATIKESLTALHLANTGEDPQEISFEAGEEVEIISEFERHYLVRKDSGEVFNLLKERVDKG